MEGLLVSFPYMLRKQTLTIPGEADILGRKDQHHSQEFARCKPTISVISSLLSLRHRTVSKTQGESKFNESYRLATLPATGWLEDATFDFGDARGGAREEVTCSIAYSDLKVRYKRE